MSAFQYRRARSPLDEVWAVRLDRDGPRHAVQGRNSKVTRCGEKFLGVPPTLERLPINCEACVEWLGCLPKEG